MRIDRRVTPGLRRTILAGAVLAGALAGALPPLPLATAQESRPRADEVQVPAPPGTGTGTAGTGIDAAAAKDAARDAAAAAKDAAREAAAAGKDAARDAAAAAKDAARDAAPAPRRNAITADIEVSGDGEPTVRRRIVVGAGPRDQEYDSFEQFVENDPGLARMFFGIVFVVFLTPVLIIGLVIWYKLRRARMTNEAMLRLAERGVVPAADAMHAIASGRAPAAVEALAAGTPGFLPQAEHAAAVRSRTAWSDLRKGVIMGTIGLAFVFYSMLDDGTPNWIGLVLMFLGIGYSMLWFFEDRHLAAQRPPAPPPAPAPYAATIPAAAPAPGPAPGTSSGSGERPS